MVDTALAPPFAYHGGKARLAAWIVSLMPKHRVYVEPFAGSLAVLLAKPQAKIEVVNDLNGELVNFWRMLRERPDELIAACDLTLYARDEYETAWTAPDSDDSIEQARRFWVKVSQGVASKVGHKSGWQRSHGYGGGHTSKAATLRRKVQHLAAVSDRIGGVMIDNRPALDVLNHFSTPDSLAYVDPPYVGFDKAGPYSHGMTDDEHRDLASSLHDFAGHVLLSGYPSDLYDELYADWHRLERAARAGTANIASTNFARTEVVWSNRPVNQQVSLL